jgi:prepilin-type N-terminal cleavage/methylation domain-containing protein
MSIIPPSKKSGFTLIEIVIVLAIAALIMVIVFVAVSGAQRSRRDAVTKKAAYQALVAMATYAGINNGDYPTASKGQAQLNSIMSGVKDGKGNQPYYCNTTIFDGNFANRVGYCFEQTEVDVYYAGNVICDTANPGAWKAPTLLITYPKNGAVTYYSENGSRGICIDNTQQ